MGLGVTLGNALSGMGVAQDALTVLSRNVANAGTPGYHRQSAGVVNAAAGYVRTNGVDRAFSQSLENYYTRSAAEAGYANVRASFLDRVQEAFGKPGSAGSLDTAYGKFENALRALATSPDDYATRTGVLAEAQAMAETLNRLSQEIGGLRRDTETRIAGAAENLNRMLSGLEDVNGKLADSGADPGSRAALLDQRDRLVAGLSEIVDIKVDYRADHSVAITTKSGVGLLDVRAARFSFEKRGDAGAGVLMLHSFSGAGIDVVQQGVVKSGELAGLIELRDRTLVDTQAQLDAAAAALAQSLSSEDVTSTPAASGPQSGLAIDLAGTRAGNGFTLIYKENGTEKAVRVVRVEDPAKLPMDSIGEDGVRTTGLSFAGGAAGVAAGLSAALGPGLSITASGADTLQVLDDGVGNTTDVLGLAGRRTVSGLTGDGLSLNLFVDAHGLDFTDSLDGAGQQAGFAARIRVNPAVAADNTLLVQYEAGGTLGDAARASHLLDRLTGLDFADSTGTDLDRSRFRFAGTVGELVAQVMNRQGEIAAIASDSSDTQNLAMEALSQRLEAEYGVDVDEEMARLMELQTAYAANARVLSTVQTLIDTLLRM